MTLTWSGHPEKLLTISEFAAEAGVHRGTILNALKQGRIQSACRDDDELLIERSQIERAAFDPNRVGTRSPKWSDADDAALLELYGKATVPQVAAYLGRTVVAIQQRAHKLRQLRVGNPRSHGALTTPFIVPSSAILLAKTCIRCGELRGSEFYSKSRTGGARHPTCYVCLRSDKAGPSESLKAHNLVGEAMQRATIEAGADKSGQPYTNAETDRLLTQGVSDFELAIELHRTYYAVRIRRQHLGVTPRKNKLGTARWDIGLDVSAAAARDYFTEIGGPVPESLWEWNNENEGANA